MRRRGSTAWRALLVRLSVGRQALSSDREQAMLLALRLLPRQLAVVLARAAGSAKRPTSLGALAAWRAGRPAEALAQIEAGAHSGPRPAARMVRVAAALDRSDLAGPLLARVPADERAPLTARLALQEGRLDEALATADDSRAARKTKRRAQRELATLEPGWLPTVARRPVTPQPGRVLHVVTNALPLTNAGYTMRTHLIARAEQAAGMSTHVVTRLGYPAAQGRKAGPAEFVLDGVTYHRLLPPRGLPTDPHQRLTVHASELSGLVHQLQPAVLHAATDHLNGRVALAVGAAAGLPVVYEVRGFLEQSWLSRSGRDAEQARASLRYRLTRESETACMRAAGAVVTLSQTMREEIVARGIAGDRVHVVPNAVDDELLRPAPDPGPLRASWGIRSGELVVGTIGTLYAHEGIADLIDAVAELRTSDPSVRLVVVGDGPELPQLRRHADERCLGDAAIFTGRVAFDRIHEHYAAIDVFAVPRPDHDVTRLVSPLKPVEAMATGRAVVVSDLPALRELVEDGVTGVISPPGNPPALAEALRRLLYDPAARSALGKAAADWVATDRTWARNAERYREIYRSLGASDH